jgi:hypothetical protein
MSWAPGQPISETLGGAPTVLEIGCFDSRLRPEYLWGDVKWFFDELIFDNPEKLCTDLKV